MNNGNLHQRVRLCKALLSLMGFSHLWTSQGPTAEARTYLDQYGGPMSNPQWILYQVVWYAWGRPADVKVQEVMQLPAPYADLVTRLLNALVVGPAAVEDCIRRIQKILDDSKAPFHRLA